MKKDEETKERIFELACGCGTKGGEVRFSEKDPRSDKELEALCRATYSHVCDTCCCKDGICDKHAKCDEQGAIIEPRVHITNNAHTP